MRIWSLHPSYLDVKGLVALWRETLLAKHVLEGKTRGYKNHPQLERFKSTTNPVGYVNAYLSEVCKEATSRGYNFNKTKIGSFNAKKIDKLSVTDGQLEYEFKHLLIKLKKRDHDKYKNLNEKLENREKIIPHSLFKVVKGDVESWEKQKN